MLFLGITGGIGAGKSTVLDYLAQLPDTEVMLADEIAKDLMMPGTACYRELYEIYGPQGSNPKDIYLPDGSFNRPEMARVIFRDDAERIRVNGIVHPAVREEVRRRVQEAREEGRLQLLVFECALLLEDEYDRECDECWYIYTSVENRRARLKASRGYSDDKIDTIMATQMPDEVFRQKCGEMIDNNGSCGETHAKLGKLLLARGIRCGL